MSLSRFPDFLAHLAQDATSAEDEVPALERLVEAAPGHVTAHVALACAREVNGEWEAARQSWKRAHLLMPASPAVRAGLKRTAHRRADSASPAETASEAPTAQEASSEETEPSPFLIGEAPEVLPREGSSSKAPPSTEATDEGPGELSRPPDTFDDLDSLIEDLEGARIDPDPNPASAPTPNLESDVDDMVSPTLARIYERQQQHTEAARVYQRLAGEASDPETSDEYRRKAEAMRKQAEAAEGSERE